MTAKTMQSIAAGLFIAAALITAVYYLFPNDAAAKPKAKLSVKEMKEELVAEGYVIKTEKEWEAQVAAVEAAEKKAKKAEKTANAAKKAANAAEKTAKAANEKADKAKEEPKDEPKTEAPAEEKIVYRTVLFVASGMTSIDVGNALVTAKIIPNALEFTQEVEKRGLANKLKPGMYEVESGMSMDEVIRKIFP